MDITTKNRVSVADMKKYYAETHPYTPNGQRVGRWAKAIGFKLTKQMTHGKVVYFYIKDDKDDIQSL